MACRTGQKVLDLAVDSSDELPAVSAASQLSAEVCVPRAVAPAYTSATVTFAITQSVYQRRTQLARSRLRIRKPL